MLLTFQVGVRHIASAQLHNITQCPVALALREALGLPVSVNNHKIFFYTAVFAKMLGSVRISTDLTKQINSYDNGGMFTPGYYTLEVLDTVLVQHIENLPKVIFD